jgi:hypothetical protein
MGYNAAECVLDLLIVISRFDVGDESGAEDLLTVAHWL